MSTKSSNGTTDTKANLDNRSRQLNKEHDAYWQARGEPGRPASSDATSTDASTQPKKS